MKKTRRNSQVTENRRARFDYALNEELVCGMSLTGLEVRAIRDHHVQLKGAFVTIKDGQVWLNNLTLGAETARNIPLLLTKRQRLGLEKAKMAGLALVPLKILAGGRYIKLVVATGKGRKKYDKRRVIAERDLARERR